MSKKLIVAIFLIGVLVLNFAYIKRTGQYAKNKYHLVKQDSGLSMEEFTKKTNNNDKIVFVYFSATWCVPCTKLKPIIDQIETEESQNMVLLRIDVDKNPLVSSYLEINTLPLFIIYKKGKVVWSKNSMLSKQELEHQIEKWGKN